MNVLLLDFFREVWKTRGRFFAIFMIVALGCGFFAGVKVTCPDMILTAETYFRNQNLMDFQLKSTYGFNQEDIDALKSDATIKDLSVGYSSDFFVDLDVSADSIVRAYSYRKDDPVNKLILKEGRFPQAENECLTEENVFTGEDLALGKTITLKTDGDINSVIKVSTYKIVGIVESPLYITFDRGTSKLGNGNVDSFLYLPAESFKYEYYTDIFLTLKDTSSISPFSDKYETIIKDYTEKLKAVAEVQQNVRFEDVIHEATEKLDDAKQKLAEGILKRDTEIGSAQKQLNNAKAELEKGKLEYVANIDRFNSEISSSEAKIAAAEAELLKGKAEYDKGKAANDEALAKQNVAESSLLELKSLLTDLDAVLKEEENSSTDHTILIEKIKKSTLEKTIKDELTNILTNPLVKKNLSEVIDQIKQSATETEDSLKTAALALKATEETLKQSKTKLDESFAELNKNKLLLEENKKTGQQKLDNAYLLLKTSEETISKNESKFFTEKKEADAKINDGKIEIANAEKQISELKNPKWYVFDRNNNPGYSGYETDAQRVDNIAAVFPIFFILVAALVCLTTMARMVEEQRTQIGVLKALGYSKLRILAKYLGYAAFASILGSAVGLSIGFQLFPTIIFNAYKNLYKMADIITVFRIDYAVLCTLAAASCTTLSALVVCFAELHTVPAQLMRPKAPKMGKRVFLERITFLWSRMSFIYKVTIRNIFRYKNRVLMTVVGIAGCTALMLAGFGLRYSISSIIDKQFGELFHYDMVGIIDDTIDSGSLNVLKTQLSSNTLLGSSMTVYQKSFTANKDSSKVDFTLFVPENEKAIEDYITLKDRTSNKKVAITKDGAVIAEKIAKILKLKVGDKITLTGTDDSTAEAVVSAITENYINNYIYISPEYFKKIFNKAPEYNSFVAKMKQDTEENRSLLSSALLKNSNIQGISFVTKSADKIKGILESLDLIVLVLIFSAGALAFVVLYNLTNINVNERRRELATIKVLGFYNSEVSKYIYRENIISTALGILLGLLVGVPFDFYLISASEIDAVMFTPGIDVFSFVYAIALTAFFAAVVNLSLYVKLKKIDMVESLKSIE